MTMKDQAYRAHAALQAIGITSIRRSHVHELLAAAAGYASHAAFSHVATWCDTPYAMAGISPEARLLMSRCLQLGLTPIESARARDALIEFQQKEGYAPVAFEALIRTIDGDEGDPSWQLWVWTEIIDPSRHGLSFFFEHQPQLLEGLETAAARGSVSGHLAIAKLLQSEALQFGDEEERTKRHYRRKGAWTSPFVSFADVATDMDLAEDKYRHHLFEAARRGDLRAMLDSADRYSDPAALHQMPSDAIDPMAMADLATEHEDIEKERYWLTAAAREGNTEAMRALIVEHSESLDRAWVWMHLSRLLERDLSADDYDLVHENGERYDDDIGGPGYVVGDDGIDLPPLPKELDASSRLEAERLFALIVAQQDSDE